MRGAIRVTVAAFGIVTALAGIEHGVGEVLQGSVAPEGVMILSWPDLAFFRIVSGEPAMTVVPNLLVTGILTIVASLAFLVWAALFAGTRHGGLVLIALSVAMLLVGAGFGPPLLGVILGVAATGIGSPLAWWRAHLPRGVQRALAAVWPWSLAAGIVAWLAMVPGLPILDYVFGVDSAALVLAVLLSAMGLLALSIVAGLARDLRGDDVTEAVRVPA